MRSIATWSPSSARRRIPRLVLSLVLGGALLAPASPVTAAPRTGEQELEARIADLDEELSALEADIAALEIDAAQLRQRVERGTSRVTQLLAQRDATAQLHRAHLDLSHRRTTTDEVDAALDVLLARSGVADGATDWYRAQLEAMHATTSTIDTRAVSRPPTGLRYDPAVSTIVSTNELPVTSSATENGHLQLRYAVRASLVFAELQLRLDQAERATAGPRRQLDGVLLPALGLSQERGRALSTIRDELAAELARERERNERGDRLHVPVDGPHRSSSAFGMRRHPVHGDVRMHRGIDLAAPAGTPVVAAAPGRVVAAGSRGGYGRTVDIDHGDGRLTRYAHLHAIEVTRGDQVAGRTRIGTVGATGTVTGPHLHFEVHEHGRAVDPAPWLYGPSGRP